MKSRNTKLVSLFLIVALLLAFLPSASAAKLELTAEQDATAVIPVTDSFLTDSGCQIGRYIDTVAFKEKNHVSRLKADEDVNTYVFLNEDNTKTVYYMYDAVKFVDDDGYIREKNTDLTYHVTGFSTAQNDVGLEIPTLPSSGISLSLGENQIKLYPLNGYPLSAAIRNGNSVDYPYFYGLGTTLRYTPTLSGVKEDIILSSYNGVHEFSFRLTTGGLNLYQVNNRYYLAETEDADIKFWLGCVEIFDANARPGYGTMTAETVEAGQEYILTLSADPAFLTDPNTAYPVTIDPTVEGGIFSDNATGINSIEDAPIYSGYPDSNFGTYQYNRAGYVDSSYGVGRTVVRLKGLLNDTNFKTAAEISSVKFCIADASGSAPTKVYLHAMAANSSWTETNITWNSAGIHSTDHFASANLGNGQFSYFDITNLVKMWQNNEFLFNSGFVLKAENESSGDRALYSAEHSTSSMRPYVVADYKFFMRTGSEPVYHKNCWHRDGVINVANCYSYALNYTGSISNPGSRSGGVLEETTQATVDALVTHVKNDAAVLGITCGEIATASNGYDIYAPIPEGTYRIAVCLDVSSWGYHFFRQNPDGTWSHKDGTSETATGRLSILDADDKVIYNPATCDLNFGLFNNYTNSDGTNRVAFLYVSPLGDSCCP